MTKAGQLPGGVLATFYGDDYTGASGAMEALAFAGVPTILYLERPDVERLAGAQGYRAVGIAGSSRSQSPEWMDENLPEAFETLGSFGAPLSHYKVCSTFDSSLTTGSIGRAVDLAVPILGGAWHPMLVASPAMGRYQIFGNLFAVMGGKGYRLDRHPVMSRHPVTPMRESDLTRHLALQTQRPIGLVDFVSLAGGRGTEVLAAQRAMGNEIISLDTMDEATLIEAGRLIWENRGERIFAVGSQGVEQALAAYWSAAGLLPPPAPPRAIGRVAQIACVSGSVSPITAQQIEFAIRNGFTLVRLDVTRAVEPRAWEAALHAAAADALAVLASGGSPLIATAEGPDDPAVAALREAVSASGVSTSYVNDAVGNGLGRVLEIILRKARLPRAVVAGGDTSSHAVRALGAYAVTAITPLASGSPLCQAIAEEPHAAVEIAMKGGQVGGADFFVLVRDGR